MTKHKLLPRVVLLSLALVLGVIGTQALAGSIVINLPPQPQPKKLQSQPGEPPAEKLPQHRGN